MHDDRAVVPAAQADLEVGARGMQQGLVQFLAPLLVRLDAQIDARLVRTLVATVTAILAFRHSRRGLLLSELGAYLAGPAHAPAGTKRLSNLLHSPKWAASLIERWLWEEACGQVARLEEDGEPVLVAWDESVLEKPESLATPDLCTVRSSSAARLLKRARRRGPPGPPVLVRGAHWVGLLVLGLHGAPTVAAMRWWSTKGAQASSKREQEEDLLATCAATWGRQVLHLWDRGFAGAPWLVQAARYQARFVLRWKAGYHLVGPDGQERAAWQIVRGKRSWGTRPLWDHQRHCWRQVGVVAVPVQHPAVATPLWLVVARPGNGLSPWYLLTTETADSLETAWAVVAAYARRWQIEWSWRCCKAELGVESVRVWRWEERTKLLLLATLAYAFLLRLLDPFLAPVREWLLRHWCHRTGRGAAQATAPLSRLRCALSWLWHTATASTGTAALLALPHYRQNTG
jgi:hypothetical protein